jgi:hypothetical protein
MNVAVAEMQPGPVTYMPAAEITPMQMLQVAVAQGADLERIQKLMDLQDRWEAKQALHAFNAALAAFKKNPPTIVKDLLNKQYNSWYTSLGNLVNTVNASMGEHGLSASWEIEQTELIAVTCILEHVLGHSRRVRLEGPPDTSGSKNTLQQIRSTLTYLKGATFEAVTGIASRQNNADDDGNGAGKRGEPSPEGYETWRADMSVKVEDGSQALQATWGKSPDEFRRYAIKWDEPWWRECKAKAQKVAK